MTNHAGTRHDKMASAVASPSDSDGSIFADDHVVRERSSSIIQLKTFTPQPLGRASAIALIIVLLCLMLPREQARTHQHGYTRRNVELICTSHNKCAFEFYQEILFNQVNHMTSINMHANDTIGSISVERLPVEFRCSNRTLFYTRDTDYTVFSATRRAQMGSCTRNTSSSEIAELANASQYPGYSGCEPSYGGLLRGCLLLLPACSFYRVAHVPKDSVVYEVAKCMEWKPSIRSKVSTLQQKYPQNTRLTTTYDKNRRHLNNGNIVHETIMRSIEKHLCNHKK
ncbi:hypothetical protein RB195_022097 [Necator americanus]|uniref:Phlebovirus glycoprotein G2 fusion domain-containing protein n=1 Tax=Necator americanus TaxID=51031 RepID=A0ABR1EE66_NECAM